MSKFDAIFNEIRFSEKYLRTSGLGTCDAVFHKCFFFGNIGHICELFIGAIIKGFQ